MTFDKTLTPSWVEKNGAEFLTHKYVAIYGNILMLEHSILLVDLIDEYIIYHI